MTENETIGYVIWDDETVDLAMTTIDHKILDTNTRPNDITFPPDWSILVKISRRLFPPLVCRYTSFARIYGMA